ncbi:YpmS family protein [Weissella coleopterorum]|uniref:YpmS family protein n=1 Tax=Weissella coleopterorum TaxID=2714949 RepID=A0A6G8B031_9LACO|nr:YpmS family protein [Weissella coleopterorum]QIL50597.1 YpmS family protein [Weissella coleopterorum]
MVKKGLSKEQNRLRQQGVFWGIGGTLIVLVLGMLILIVLPQGKEQQFSSHQQLQMTDASMEVQLTKKNLNAWMNKYLNDDPSLKKRLRFEMGQSSMMVYGTERLLGQDVDYGMKMTPSVTKDGNLLLHADSVAVGQLPLPVNYVMGGLASHLDLPAWVNVNSKEQTILINFKKVPKVSGMQIKVKEINMKKDHFVFQVGLPK